MGLVSKCENTFFSCSKLIRRVLVSYGEIKNIIRKKELWSRVELTPNQKKEIQDYYRVVYGKSIPDWWHRLYQSYMGVFRVDYLPEFLLSAQLEPRLNNYREAGFLEDKNLLDVFFSNIEGVRVPRTYGSCVRGKYRNCRSELVSKDKLCCELENIGLCVLKKTINTSSGRDVMVCEFVKGIDIRNNKTVDQLVAAFGKDFVVQQCIIQHPQLQLLNPSSVNTFRVMSYICDDQIKVCPIALRLGRNNADRDNLHYGGISVGISADGTLRKYAFSEYGERFESHPDTGIVFENFELPNVDKLKNAAVSLHSRIPYLGLISWDLTFDTEENVVLIEANTTGQSAWFPQMVNGEPLFGKDTAMMLKKIRKG